MALRLVQTLCLLLLLSGGVRAGVVQSSVVNFPVSGRVVVRAREEVGRFPQMLFVAERTGEVLLASSIEDKKGWLVPDREDSTPPRLRFRVIRSRGFPSPLIMSVGLSQGGSDSASYLTVFGEVGGRIVRLNGEPFFANVQGGYYLGYLSRGFGHGLAVWNFVWGGGAGEWHYGAHKYEIEIYRLRGDKLERTLRRVSRRRYGPDEGAKSLREVGVRAADQRAGIPLIKDAPE